MAEKDPTNPWALGPEATKPLPRGRNALSRESVLASQRGRMLHAVLVVTAAKGFRYAVVGDVISEAGVSRKAFYEQFNDFEDCWFQAYDTAIDVVFNEMAAAAAEADPAAGPEARLKASMGALMRLIADEPRVAHATIIEVGGGGPEGLKADRATIHRWADLLLAAWDGGDPAEPSSSRRIEGLAAVSIVVGICSDYLVAETADQLPALSDQVTELMVAALGR